MGGQKQTALIMCRTRILNSQHNKICNCRLLFQFLWSLYLFGVKHFLTQNFNEFHTQTNFFHFSNDLNLKLGTVSEVLSNFYTKTIFRKFKVCTIKLDRLILFIFKIGLRALSDYTRQQEHSGLSCEQTVPAKSQELSYQIPTNTNNKTKYFRLRLY